MTNVTDCETGGIDLCAKLSLQLEKCDFFFSDQTIKKVWDYAF